MKEWQFGVILVCLVGAWPGSAAGQQPDPAFGEIVQIDGSKNPELIPQWSAWGYAFRVFAGGPRMLPSSVLAHVTDAEQALIIREADAVQASDVTCMARHRKILAESRHQKTGRRRQGSARAVAGLPMGNSARPRSRPGRPYTGRTGGTHSLRRVDQSGNLAVDSEKGSRQIPGTRVTALTTRGDI